MPTPAGGPAVIEAPPPPQSTPAAVGAPAEGAAVPLPAAPVIPAAPPPPGTPATAAPLPTPGTGTGTGSAPPAGLFFLGTGLAVAGALGMALAIGWPLVTALRGARASAPGDVPAISLVLLIVGFGACFPSLLTDGSGEGYSTMRVAVLAIVCVFCAVTLKAGWGAQNAAELTVNDSWWHVLTVALGGKVAQAFAEAWKGGGPRQPGGGGQGHGG